MRPRRKLFIAFLILGAFLLHGSADSATFDIKPIKIFFDADTRIEKLTINNASEDDLSLQIKVYKWLQNEKGEDIYDETGDIVIFPKVLRIKKGDERLIRIGTNLKPEINEKTYRIYIEELPSKEGRQEGATVRLLMRTGIPVFISPVKSEAEGKIESVFVKNGKVEVAVKNDGNLHFIITSLSIKGEDSQGKELFSKELGGWYLLNGTSRLYAAEIPPGVCADTARLKLEIKTNRFNLNDKFDMDKSMCLP